MRSVFAGVTTRGRAFIAAGIAAGGFGLGLGQRELLSLGGVLILLPLLSALAAGRARYRVRCLRQIEPTRVPAGQAATVTIQLDNVTRLPTGLLLAEDTIPYSLGTRPRFVLDRIEAGGSRRITYRLQSDRRGRYEIGPLHVRVADVFGLVRLGRSVALPGTLVVTPAGRRVRAELHRAVAECGLVLGKVGEADLRTLRDLLAKVAIPLQ